MDLIERVPFYVPSQVLITFNNDLTYYMDQSPPLKADSRSAGQEIHLSLWIPNVHYRIFLSGFSAKIFHAFLIFIMLHAPPIFSSVI
jgi:hypothetical protein